MTTPALIAANEIAGIINAQWENDTDKPTVLTRLSPAFNTVDGTEQIPAAYTIPVSHGIKRASRYHYDNSIEIAFVFITEADETTAQNLMADVYGAIKAVLDAGTKNGMHFTDAEIVEPFDYELLAASGLFRTQANIRVTAITGGE